MEIKLKTFADILQAIKVDENATWDDASVATHDIMRDLKSKSWKISGISTNGFKVKHDNGCVGSVVFDPSLKESVDDIDEAMKIQDIIKTLQDAKDKTEAALKGFDEEIYNSGAIENDIDEVQSKLLKIINKLKAGNYNK